MKFAYDNHIWILTDEKAQQAFISRDGRNWYTREGKPVSTNKEESLIRHLGGYQVLCQLEGRQSLDIVYRLAEKPTKKAKA